MKHGLPIIEKLLATDYLPHFNEQSIVGWFVQVEAAHWRIHRMIQSAQSTALNEGEHENAYVYPEYRQELERYQKWMDAAKPYLPDWYKPGYRFEVEAALSDVFSNISQEVGETIDQRRQAGVHCTPDNPLGAQQIALERCLRRVMRIIMPLVWGQKAP